MAYKCPGKTVGKPCGWFVRFYILDDAEYSSIIIDKYRDGKIFWIPTDDFKNNQIIKERLKSLGYF